MGCGDHIYVHRLGYTHHGIDCGDGTVIHYTGEVGQKSNAVVRRTTLMDFSKNAQINTRIYGLSDPAGEVLRRAESRLDETSYNLAFSNCEHFATWCKTGKHQSEQVKNAASFGGGAVGGGATIAAGLGAVSATGAAAGLSGSGIMSGLAYIGGAVGGGAVAGVAVIGSAPALITTAAMMSVLRDDPILHNTEREARKIGRISTFVGAAGGSVTAVGAVTTFGAVAGLSAAGITSGLGAIGAAVGGGMVAGVVVTAAAPAVIAAASGYGIYRLWRKIRSR